MTVDEKVERLRKVVRGNRHVNAEYSIRDAVLYSLGERRPSRFRTPISSAKSRCEAAGIVCCEVRYTHSANGRRELVLGKALMAYYDVHGEFNSAGSYGVTGVKTLHVFNTLMRSLAKTQPVWRY